MMVLEATFYSRHTRRKRQGSGKGQDPGGDLSRWSWVKKRKGKRRGAMIKKGQGKMEKRWCGRAGEPGGDWANKRRVDRAGHY